MYANLNADHPVFAGRKYLSQNDYTDARQALAYLKNESNFFDGPLPGDTPVRSESSSLTWESKYIDHLNRSIGEQKFEVPRTGISRFDPYESGRVDVSPIGNNFNDYRPASSNNITFPRFDPTVATNALSHGNGVQNHFHQTALDATPVRTNSSFLISANNYSCDFESSVNYHNFTQHALSNGDTIVTNIRGAQSVDLGSAEIPRFNQSDLEHANSIRQAFLYGNDVQDQSHQLVPNARRERSTAG